MKKISLLNIVNKSRVKLFYPGLVFLIISIIIIINGLVELQQSKSELNDLMRNQARSLLKTMIVSSQNTLASEELLEESVKERLLNNAVFIKLLFSQNKITDDFLRDFAARQNLFRVNIFNRNGERIYSNMKKMGKGMHMMGQHLDLAPIFSGEKDTVIIGMKGARFRPGTRYVVALADKNRNAFVVNVEAEQLERLKETGNLDFLINQIVTPDEIVYYALQDTNGVIVSSENFRGLDNIKDSKFLMNALTEKKFMSRIIEFNSNDVFEAVQQFDYNENKIGILRIGLSIDYLNQLNKRTSNRILINSIILFASGIILIIIIFLRQNYKTLKRQYDAVETFSSDVIRTVSDAVIVYDNVNGIKVFNNAAEKLFGLNNDEVLGKQPEAIIDKNICTKIFGSPSLLTNIESRINEQTKNLLISGNSFNDENKTLNNVFVIRDLTDTKKLELQLQRKERLTAMGALASGVAHEIRNPLNSIGTIAQQLNKDFEPFDNKEEYHKLSNIIYSEVKRINETVTNFLRFAKPDPMLPAKFNLSELLKEIRNQYSGKLKTENVALTLSLEYDPEVIWDKDQIRQVMVNLINNARDAIEKQGEINIRVIRLNDTERDVEIRISDTGKGIPEDIRNKIFNLYFSTKASGTGIGLSIVQKIIDEHNGLILVESGNSGTTFILQMPDKII